MGKLPFLHTTPSWETLLLELTFSETASVSGPQQIQAAKRFAHNSGTPQHKADLHVGSKAQIVGLQRAIELNGLQVLVLEEEEGHGTGGKERRNGSCQVRGKAVVVICMNNPGLGFGFI